MNQYAQDLLEQIWKDLKPSRRKSVEKMVNELWAAWCCLMYDAVSARAERIKTEKTRAELQADFDRRISSEGFASDFYRFHGVRAPQFMGGHETPPGACVSTNICANMSL